MEIRKAKKFITAIGGVTKRYAIKTNPFAYASLSDYLDVIFRKSKNDLLDEFNIEMIRVKSNFKFSERNMEVDELDIEKYRPNSFLEYKQLNSDIQDIQNKLEELLFAKK